MNLSDKFKLYIREENLFQARDRLLVAVSGGIDSVVLCELCSQAGYDFVIAHCNFQLRGNDSSRDEDFVKALAQKYDVPFYVKKFDRIEFTNSKKSIEETARDLRYEWFYSLVGNKILDYKVGDESENSAQALKYILTAHHAEDNVETVLMKFFRGTGVKGLRGILPKQGKIIRPLLFARRYEIEAFVKYNDLEYVIDHTNKESDFTRNYFRNTIIPMVAESFPEAAKNILNNIRRFKETEILYQQAIEAHKKKLLEKKGNEVHISVLKLLKTVPLASVMYEITKDFGFTAHQAEEATGLLKSETGKFMQSASHRIFRNRNWLIISPLQTTDAGHILIEEDNDRIDFNHGTLLLRKITGTGFTILNDHLTAQLDLSQIKFPLLLRKWKQGDYFYPLGMQKKKKLSRFLIDQKLSLTQKENTWVIETDRKIMWVVGLRIDNRFRITGNTKRMYIINFLGGTGNKTDHPLK